MSSRDYLNLPTPPVLPSIHWACKHTVASAIGDIHSDAMSLLIPHPTPPLLSSISRDHLPLPTHLIWLSITQSHHRDTVASVIFPESSIPRTHCLFLVLLRRLCCCCWFHGPVSERLLTFELLTSYFLWCRFARVTVGRAIPPNLVGNDTDENIWGANWIPKLFYKEYTILWFEFDLCG